MGGSLFAVGGGTEVAAGREDDETEGGAAFDDVAGTDFDVLNYALPLENTGNADYRETLNAFSPEQFQESEPVSGHSTETDLSVYEIIEVIGEHEATHVDVLSRAVTLLGGEPVGESEYDFGVESVEEFSGLTQVFENTGVAAYAGAAPFVENPDLLGTALSTHGVETATPPF